MGAMLYLDIVWLEGTRSQTRCGVIRKEDGNVCRIHELKGRLG